MSAAGRRRLSDARRILAVQALRGFAYGLGSVVLGVSLARRGLAPHEVAGVFAALLAGAAVVSLAVARYADRAGRRRVYVLLLAAMASAGAVYAFADSLALLILVALTGTLATDVVDSGPIGSLEQAMLPQVAPRQELAATFALYGMTATVAGSVGALAAAGPALTGTRSDAWLLTYTVTGVAACLIALRLSPAVEAARDPGGPVAALHRSRGIVRRLAALFALDAFGGGFVVHAFIAYWFAERFGTPERTLALLFFAVGLLQAVSFHAAVRLARRIGLVRTMVFTHLPSNALLAAVALAPGEGTAIALLLARFALSQMDVPVRQAYVVGSVDASERTAASAYTNTARIVARPTAPLLSGAVLQLGLGAPFVVAGALKASYDLLLFALFRSREPRLAAPRAQE